MKHPRILFILGVFLLSVLKPLKAQYVQAAGKAIVDGKGDTLLIRAMGIGGWMVQEGYMLQTASFASPQHKIKDTIQDLIGATATEAFYEAWLENHFSKADVDSMAAWGFNTVRVPLQLQSIHITHRRGACPWPKHVVNERLSSR